MEVEEDMEEMVVIFMEMFLVIMEEVEAEDMEEMVVVDMVIPVVEAEDMVAMEEMEEKDGEAVVVDTVQMLKEEMEILAMLVEAVVADIMHLVVMVTVNKSKVKKHLITEVVEAVVEHMDLEEMEVVMDCMVEAVEVVGPMVVMVFVLSNTGIGCNF